MIQKICTESNNYIDYVQIIIFYGDINRLLHQLNLCTSYVIRVFSIPLKFFTQDIVN